MEVSRPGKSLDLFSSDLQAICVHPMVLIAGRSVQRELKNIVGWKFDSHPGMPRYMAKAAGKFEDAHDLLKGSLVLVAVDRIINRGCTSSDSTSKRARLLRHGISGNRGRSLASRHIKVRWNPDPLPRRMRMGFSKNGQTNLCKSALAV